MPGLKRQVNKAVKVLKLSERFGGINGAQLRKAKGFILLSQWKGAYFVSGAVAYGFFMKRVLNREWSNPVSIGMMQAGVGFQFGGTKEQIIILLESDHAVKAFETHGQLTLDGQVGFSFGDIGTSGKAGLNGGVRGITGTTANATAKGVYIGVSVDGGILFMNSIDNRRVYGKKLGTKKNILNDPSTLPANKTGEDILRLKHVLKNMSLGVKIHANAVALKNQIDALYRRQRESDIEQKQSDSDDSDFGESNLSSGYVAVQSIAEFERVTSFRLDL